MRTPEQWAKRLTVFDDEGVAAIVKAAQREAIEAAAAESGWRDIESAPKDGTHFLAVVDGLVRVVAWAKTSHVPMRGFCIADQGVEDYDLCEPSFWQSMPAPPASAGERDE